MRRFLPCLFVFAFVIFFICPSAPCQTRELVTNGGFEKGAEGWDLQGGKLVTGKKQARKGENCVMGEVTEPKKACFIRRTFTLSADCIYRFSFWARARRQKGQKPGRFGIKAVLWLNNAKTKLRRSAGTIKSIPGRWRRFTIPFSVPSTGEWRVDLVVPSSFGGMLGRAWVDEISLTEISLPPRIAVTDDDRFNERPTLAVSGDGSAYCAMLSFKDGKDSIRLARLTNPAAEKPEIAMLPDVNLPGCEGVWRVAMAPAKTGAWLAASCDVGGNWDLYLWKIAPEGAGSPIRVTKDPATDINPGIATAGNRMFLTWETNRSGPRQIMVAEVTDGKIGEAKPLSTKETWNYYPSIAGDGSGRAWVVWESFREGSYDIYGASFDGQTWAAERCLSKDPRIEHRPVVAFGKDGPWMAWEIMIYPYPAYRTGAAKEQRVVAARLDDDGLKSSKEILGLFNNFSQQPTLACDADGRVWVCARTARDRAGWDVVLRAYCGEKWSDERLLTPDTGRAQPCPMAVAGGRLLVAMQYDNVAGRYKSIEETVKEKSNIALCSLDLGSGPPEQPRDLVKFELPQTNFDLPDHRKPYGEDLPRRTIQYKGQTLQLLWGQFHEHSEISICNRKGDLCPEDNYGYNRDIHKMDFCALTDHGYNLSPAIWNYLSKIVRTQNDPGIFVSFLGEEWTSTFEEKSKEHPFGFYGHRNLIFADAKFPRWFNAMNRDTPSDVWAALRKMDADFIQIPHQLADDGNVPTDWNYVDEVAQPIAEIFQARQSYEYRGCPRQAKRVVSGDGYFMQEAWAKGVVIGVIASPDHGGGQGKAAIYAPEQTREAILDACRARHTYGTSAAKIFLDVRVNGQLMGEKVKANGGPVKVHVEVIGSRPLDRVEICRNNEFIYTKTGESEKCSFDFEDPNPLPGTSYYYVRVLQKGMQQTIANERSGKIEGSGAIPEIAWSSPVWVER
ncbi:MAG: DUF3604 domain-containing protein [Planctomycetes bacterium]|nr:DUF3604 domain-containing protein [Planctomycetota bacterium]